MHEWERRDARASGKERTHRHKQVVHAKTKLITRAHARELPGVGVGSVGG